MLEPALLAEANRQFTLCNACRYCEGLCSVFPAMELRTAFAMGDVAYLSSLCHDCRACLDACPFAPPHDLAVDIPTLMSVARAETFAHYARPRAAWRLLSRASTLGGLVVSFAAFFAVVAIASRSAGGLVDRHDRPGAFYDVIAYAWLLAPMLALSAVAVGAIVAGGWGLARETRGGARRLLSPRAAGRAALDVLALTNLRGGGGGCGYPGARRVLHHAVFYGFAAMFAATVAAAIEQDLLGRDPPYPLLSVPVLLGLAGGVSTLAGAAGFAIAGRRDRITSPGSRRLDRLFEVALTAAVASGLLVLVFRSTRLLGVLLVVHLGVVGSLFLTLPYGKLVHAIYRYVALLRAHVEPRD